MKRKIKSPGICHIQINKKNLNISILRAFVQALDLMPLKKDKFSRCPCKNYNKQLRDVIS